MGVREYNSSKKKIEVCFVVNPPSAASGNPRRQSVFPNKYLWINRRLRLPAEPHKAPILPPTDLPKDINWRNHGALRRRIIRVRMERESHEEADERREAVIASAASLRPNFKLKSGINESQLLKFQELHRRRLQIKAKSKIHKRDKGDNWKGKSHKVAIDIQECADQEPSNPTADSTSALKSESREGNILSPEDNVTRNAAGKTRQKLFWGLDTKERWERKSNM